MVGAGLLALCELALLRPYAKSRVGPGTEFLAVLDDEVMSLTYSTEGLTLTAQRSRPADRFAIQVTYADGRPPQQCVSTPDLAGQLAQLSSFTAKGSVPADQLESEYPVRLGKLALKDRMLIEAPPELDFRTNRDQARVVVSFGGDSVEVDTPVAAFSELRAGCEALARY